MELGRSVDPLSNVLIVEGSALLGGNVGSERKRLGTEFEQTYGALNVESSFIPF